MYKVINKSGTHFSVGGQNLPPFGYLNVQNVDGHLRYLESKGAISITWFTNSTANKGEK